MWKDAANPWGARKSGDTGDVEKKSGFTHREKTGKIFPHHVFHIFTKDGGIVEKIIFRKKGQTAEKMRDITRSDYKK